MEIPLEDKIEIKDESNVKIKSLINGYFCMKHNHTVLYDSKNDRYKVLSSDNIWHVGDFKIAISSAINPELTLVQWSYDPNGSSRGRKKRRLRIITHLLNYMQNCYWCKSPFDITNTQGITIEHLVPRFKGGSCHLDNLTLACARCNNERNHDDVEKEYHDKYAEKNSLTQRLKIPMSVLKT